MKKTFEPRRIIVGVDFSNAAIAALHVADRLARDYDGRITALHATPLFMPLTGAGLGFPEIISSEFLLDQEARMTDRLRDWIAEVSDAPERVSTMVIHDSAADALLNVADEQDAGLIITGSHSHGRLHQFFLGSIAERVVHRSKRPVLTVPPATDGRLRAVLCPVNYGAVAKEAAEVARSIASHAGAELILLHLVEPAVFTDAAGEFERMSRFLGEDLVNASSTKLLVQRGDPAERVLLFANAHEVDLLVVGAQHRRFANVTVIGSTTEKITRFAKCSVLTIARPLDAKREEGVATPEATAMA